MTEPTQQVTMTFTLAEKDVMRLLGTLSNKDFRINTLTFITPWRDVAVFAPVSLDGYNVWEDEENSAAEGEDSGLDEESREINAIAEILHNEDGSRWYKADVYLDRARSLYLAGVRAK